MTLCIRRFVSTYFELDHLQYTLFIPDFLELLARLEIGKTLSQMAAVDSHGHAHRRKRAIDPIVLTEQASWVSIKLWSCARLS